MTPRLRPSPATHALPRSDALAFSRDQVAHIANRSGQGPAATTDGAFTIAVSSPRMPTCKRGFAANFAMYVAGAAAADGKRVCLVDTDLESRDVGLRFGVTGPHLLDIANNPALRDSPSALVAAISVIDPPGLSVLPIALPHDALRPLLRTKAVTLIERLRIAFDVVVVDTPTGIGTGQEPWEGALLGQIDALLVAVSADAASFGGALRYLNLIGDARLRGWLPQTFDTRLVLTGSEEDGTRELLTERALDRTLRGIPVIASIPQLWGRGRPAAPPAAARHPGLDKEFAAILRELGGLKPRTRAT